MTSQKKKKNTITYYQLFIECKKALHIPTSIASSNRPAGTIHHANYPEYIKTCEIAGKN